MYNQKTHKLSNLFVFYNHQFIFLGLVILSRIKVVLTWVADRNRKLGKFIMTEMSRFETFDEVVLASIQFVGDCALLHRVDNLLCRYLSPSLANPSCNEWKAWVPHVASTCELVWSVHHPFLVEHLNFALQRSVPRYVRCLDQSGAPARDHCHVDSHFTHDCFRRLR